MRALITRPKEDSAGLEQELMRRGYRPFIEPMLAIERLPDADVELSRAQALLFTSSNGVRAFAALSDRRDIAAFAVGDATARTCREAGFPNVHSAGGDVDDLAKLVIDNCSPENGRLVHVAGSVIAGDLAGALEAAAFEVTRLPLYSARAAAALTEELQALLKRGRLDLALFFSPRTAATFVNLVRAAGLEDACHRVDALCLSPAVARRAGELPWRRITIAAEPNQSALLAALDAQPSRDRSNQRT